MDRSTLLALLQMPGTKFNNLVRDRLLPFAPERVGPRKRADYTARNALMLGVADTLAGLGVAWASAAASVRNSTEDLCEALASRGEGGGDIYLAQVRYLSFDVESNEGAYLTLELVCDLAELDFEMGLQRRSLAPEQSRILPPPDSVVLVNVSERLRLMRAIANVRPSHERLCRELDELGVGT